MSSQCNSNPCPYIHDLDHMRRFQHLPQVGPNHNVTAPPNQGKAYYVPETRKKCPYGRTCHIMIQGDEYHYFSYTHDHEPEAAIAGTTNTANTANTANTTRAAPTVHTPPPVQKTLCPQELHMSPCLDQTPEHLNKYFHLNNVAPMPVAAHNTYNPFASQIPVASPGGHYPAVTPRCTKYEGCPLTRGHPTSTAHCDQFKHKCDHGKQCTFQNNPVHTRRFDH